jgi:hypothetical protein
MPNPYAFPAILPPQIEPSLAPIVTAPLPSQASWRLQPRYEARSTFVSAQHVLETGFGNFSPRNIGPDIEFQFGISPNCEEQHLPDLDFCLWQRDADVLLETLGHRSYDFGSFVGNSFSPTEEETQVMGTTSTHEKKVQKAHEQFIRMLRSHKVTESMAMYDSSYDFQFYRLFQGDKTPAKKNALNNIMKRWTQLFYCRLDGKPYQPSVFMVLLHSLFGEFARRGVRYSLVKDFKHAGGFMRDVEHRWNQETILDSTFAARPTKVKMPEDYAKNIRAAVKEGLLDPLNDVDDCMLLFACACGTMLGFRGNQVRFWLIVIFLFVHFCVFFF